MNLCTIEHNSTKKRASGDSSSHAQAQTLLLTRDPSVLGYTETIPRVLKENKSERHAKMCILFLYQNKEPSQKLFSFSKPASRTLILAATKLSSHIHLPAISHRLILQGPQEQPDKPVRAASSAAHAASSASSKLTNGVSAPQP